MSDTHISPAQIRAARGLLKWSAADLAAKSGVSLNTVQRAENGSTPKGAKPETLLALQRALQHAGIELIAENGGGDGVRFAKPARKRKRKPR